jgi:hypothetical protein
MSGEQVIYHDIPSPRPPPPQIPSGAPAEVVNDSSPPPKKKCGFLTKFIIVTLVICLIVFLAVGFSPVGRFSAGNKGSEPDKSATGGATEPTYEPTYFPTSWVPTYSPTPGEEEEEAVVTTTTTVAATQAAVATTVAAVVDEEDEDGNVTTTEEASLDLSWIDELGNSTTNITNANVTSTTNATEAAVITTEMTTTTTTTPALICNLQIQYTIKSPNATYALTSKSDNTTTIFPTEPNEFDGVEEWLYLDQEFEVELCVEAGEYELTMSEGVCIEGTLRDKLIFYQCAAGRIEVKIE